MSGPRRREVRRRLRSLAEAPVPPPPRQLADRIKAEIPEELVAPPPLGEPAPHRRRLEVHRWRLAAVVVMTVAAATALWWMRPGGERGPATDGAAPAATGAADQHSPGRRADELAAPPPVAERRQAPAFQDRALAGEADEPVASPPPRPGPAPEAGPGATSTAAVVGGSRGDSPAAGPIEREGAAAAEEEVARRETRALADAMAASPGGPQPPAGAEERAVREERAFPAVAAGAPESTPSAAPDAAPRARLATPMPGLRANEAAAAAAPARETAPREALATVRGALDAGRLPAPAEVDVAGLVAAFAPGGRASGSAGALAADGGPPPYPAPPQVRLLRFAIAPRFAESGASPRVAVAEVEFDSRRWARVRRIGGGELAVGDEGRRIDVVEFAAGAGLELLYEAELRPGAAAPAAPLAALTLRSSVRGGSAGAAQAVTLDLEAGGVAAVWEDATPAFRLAALAGGLAEALADPLPEGEVRLAEIARRARRLAAGDLAGAAAADDLAALASRAAELASR